MSVRAVLASLLLAAICAAAGACLASAATLIHSNDVFGEIEPCGCRSNPLGGLSRRDGFLRTLQDRSLLQLDAGDLLFPTDTVPELLREQSVVQARSLLKILALQKLSAVAPGEKDFALGTSTFMTLTRGSKVPFLAANLFRKKDGKRLLEAHRSFTLSEGGKPLKVSVIGLVGEDLAWPRDLKAKPAIDAARTEAKALRSQADILIALTHEGIESDRALAKAVPEIDVIVGGHTQTFLQKPEQVGHTLILQSSFRNQYIGALPLGALTGYRLVGLDAGYDSPAQAPSKTDDLIRSFKEEVAKVNSAAPAEAASVHGAAKYQTFPVCAECHLKQFDFWRKTAHARALEPLVKRGQAGNKECLSCHTVGLGEPGGLRNIASLAEFKVEDKDQAGDTPPPAVETGALNSFLKRIREADSLQEPIETLKGAKLPLDHAIGTLSRSWTPVQCENCHGPGGDHPFGEAHLKTVETSTCLKCHTAERAPEWYTSTGKPNTDLIEAKRTLIRCPAGDLAPAPGE